MFTTIEQFLKESNINKILYHGSYNENLKVLKPKSNNNNTIPPSIFLTSKKSVAKDYGDIIYKCKINCENIIEYDVHGNSFHDYTDFEKNITDAYNDGYDCVIFRNIMDSREPKTFVPISDIYVLFNSDNIKIIE